MTAREVTIMVRVLIPSFPGDSHAIAVKHALETKGHEAVIWHTADFPTRQSASILLRPGEPTEWKILSEHLALGSGRPFDVVWYRRPVPPVMDEALHPSDQRVAQRESEHFMRGLWRLLAPAAFWVNPFYPRESPPPKPLQLHAAQEAGLRIPATLCSNDPREIRAFLAGLGGEGIFKPFYPAQWRKTDGVAHTLTSSVRLGDLPGDDVLRLCPGIFQERLEKAFELRVTWMGAMPIAALLHSQAVPEAELDWRAASWRVPVVPATLPEPVLVGCRRLMKALGLVFGCFDFVVTPTGEHVFLEVNEMGQFLWLEQCADELPLLDAFTEFLISKDPHFTWKPQRGRLSFRDVSSSVEELAARERPLHVHPPSPYHVSDIP
jgi:hypothetical protein